MKHRYACNTYIAVGMGDEVGVVNVARTAMFMREDAQKNDAYLCRRLMLTIMEALSKLFNGVCS